LRTAAVFQHFERTHAQAVAEIGGFANAGGDNAVSAQGFGALFQIHLDVLRQRRLRPEAAVRRGTSSQGQRRKQNSTHGQRLSKVRGDLSAPWLNGG
jgi:hypothetical protein